jgi:hypothetical protein
VVRRKLKEYGIEVAVKGTIWVGVGASGPRGPGKKFANMDTIRRDPAAPGLSIG